MWNKRSVDFLQDDGDTMELSSVFFKEKSLVVITNSSHLRYAHVQSIYSFKVYSRSPCCAHSEESLFSD